MGGMVREVKNRGGVDGITHEAGFEMEVWAGAAAGAASKADGVACAHCLIGLYEVLIEVAVYGLESIGVADDDVVAVALAFIGGQTYFSVECGINGVVHLDADVYSLVHALEALAIAIGRGDDAVVRHTVACYVDYL